MIVIIDYGMGNLFSVQSALSYLGGDVVVSSDAGVIGNADKLILPGVGSFYKAMANLTRTGLAVVIREAVTKGGKPILGICLGMQLLAASSTEDGFSRGFGFIDSPVERFSGAAANLKIPHVGFDSVSLTRESKLFAGLDSPADFYFTHSYRMTFAGQPYAAGTCVHGETFIAAFEKGKVCGTQFHPEKSQANGLAVLKNFMDNF